MGSTIELRSRMAAVGKIGQVTRAMKLVAASKYRKSLSILNDARPYVQAISGLALRIAETGRHHPFLAPTEGKRPLLVTIASDRGLCGAFNLNVMRKTRALAESLKGTTETIVYAALGRKAEEALKRAGIPLLMAYPNVRAKAFKETALEFPERLLKAFFEKRFDSVWLVYGSHESALVQNMRAVRLLPASFPNDIPKWPAQMPDLLEPDLPTIAQTVIPLHIKAQLRWTLLDADASEHAARMVVMEQASKNADDLTDQLRLAWNKARQAAITSELADITTGAEAIK